MVREMSAGTVLRAAVTVRVGILPLSACDEVTTTPKVQMILAFAARAAGIAAPATATVLPDASLHTTLVTAADDTVKSLISVVLAARALWPLTMSTVYVTVAPSIGSWPPVRMALAAAACINTNILLLLPAYSQSLTQPHGKPCLMA